MLAALTKLDHKVSVYVPTKNKHNEKLLPEVVNELIDYVASNLSQVAGGATSQRVNGYWLGKNGLIKEDVTVIYSYCSNLEEVTIKVLELVQYVKQEANQEAVSIEINNVLYLV